MQLVFLLTDVSGSFYGYSSSKIGHFTYYAGNDNYAESLIFMALG